MKDSKGKTKETPRLPPNQEKEVEIVNVRIPEELIVFLEQLIKKGLYKTRSEAIREFVREYVQKKRGP